MDKAKESIIYENYKKLNDTNVNSYEKRECTVKIYEEMRKLGDEEAANLLLYNNLSKYNCTEIDNALTNALQPANTSNNSLEWKSNLHNIDIISKLKINNTSSTSLKELENDFQSLRRTLSKTKPSLSTKKECITKQQQQIGIAKEQNENTNKQQKFAINRNELNMESVHRANKRQDGDDKGQEKSSNLGFRTAREELDVQHIKKFGTKAAAQNAPPPPPKRKYGIRSGFGKKFISPMLSNNDSDESGKSQDFDELQGDERLKNIDPKMVELIKAEIMDCGTKIDWSDIAGLEYAKNAIQEAVVWPMLRPDIFTGLRRPPKGILLFGPPGTGKTLIGKCVASQSKSTFFSISASSLTSKWVGDGEKMVRALFSVARCYQPAVIFIDEIDSLLTQRSDNEHESSRRIKTEFLVQLDGATTENEERLLVIGATNRPQELDEAARRRFVKRLYIPLPELKARLQLLNKLMSTERHSLNENDMGEISRLSDGYSGADMRSLCSEACLGPIRSINLSQIETIEAAQVRAVSMNDFKTALKRVKSSVSPNDLQQYVAWDGTYGSGSF